LAALLDDMGVNHRRGHIGMTWQFLDGADVSSRIRVAGKVVNRFSPLPERTVTCLIWKSTSFTRRRTASRMRSPLP